MVYTRREFLGCLAGGGLSLGLLHGPRDNEVLLNEFSVAGLRFAAAHTLVGSMHGGDPLSLVREPENPYDAFAVRLLWHGEMIGYVPRSDNRHLSRMLEQDMKLSCRIISADPDEVPWHMVQAGVWLPR